MRQGGESISDCRFHIGEGRGVGCLDSVLCFWLGLGIVVGMFIIEKVCNELHTLRVFKNRNYFAPKGQSEIV